MTTLKNATENRIFLFTVNQAVGAGKGFGAAVAEGLAALASFRASVAPAQA